MTISAVSTMDTVRLIIIERLNLSVAGYELGPDDDLWDLGMTSLTCLGLMLTIENTFGIELPEHLLMGSTFRSATAITAAVEVVRHPQHGALALEGVSPPS